MRLEVGPSVMWEAFDQTGRQVLFEARAAAATAGAELIEDVHLLEGVRRTARDLPVQRPGSRPMEALAEGVAALGRPEPRTSAASKDRLEREARFGESAKQIMQSATEIAASLGHLHVHWAHILLALAEDEAATVRDVLTRASLTSANIRDCVGNGPL